MEKLIVYFLEMKTKLKLSGVTSFKMALSFMLSEMVHSFKSVDETLVCGHLNENYSAALS